MRFASVSLAYHEPRFIQKHLNHIPDWVEENLVLVSTKPWQGKGVEGDTTAQLAREAGATVIEHDWPTEEAQRNAGQEYLYDYDWIIVLDPDEFLPDSQWDMLKQELETATGYAYCPKRQITYWKTGLKVEPEEDYRQIIAVTPDVRFVDKRVVDCPWGYLDVVLHHFSWARTDDEFWQKISHYSHAHEFNKEDWFERVWKTNQTSNLHPLTPPALATVVPAKLPKCLEDLRLWP